MLHRAGVTVALRTTETENVRNLPFHAGFAAAYGAAYGFDRAAALAAVTIVPARLFGVDRRLGSIEPGKDATLFAADGDPFEPRTQVRHLFIRGYRRRGGSEELRGRRTEDSGPVYPVLRLLSSVLRPPNPRTPRRVSGVWGAQSPTPMPDAPREAVVLLHGLGRSRLSMARMARALRRAGYRTLNRGYPSTRHGLARLAEDVVAERLAAVSRWGVERVHFVTHSLGGMLVRHYAAHVGLPAGTRAVTIAPPHRGSELADRMAHVRLVRWYCGPVLTELGTGPDGAAEGLGPLPELEVGVIAGGRGGWPFFRHLFDGPSDGTVAVERARVVGMTDFVVVPAGHSFITERRETIRQTLHFLRYGRFDHGAVWEAGDGAARRLVPRLVPRSARSRV
jgi:pimeloyl-ACP methyl ester carboxylesterase